MAGVSQRFEEQSAHFAKWEVIKDVVDQQIDLMLNYRQSGHPGGSRSKVHYLVSLLLSGAMRWDIRHPEKRFGDRFVLVAGHTAPLIYATLSVFNEALRVMHEKTGDAKYLVNGGPERMLTWEDLLGFRNMGGLPGHVEMAEKNLFVKFNTGPSGQGGGAYLQGTRLTLADTVINGNQAGLWVETQSSSIDYRGHPAILTVARDVSYRKSLEVSLSRSKRQAQYTLESIAEGVITTDNDGRIDYMNLAAETLIGTNRDAAAGHRIGELFTLVDDADRRPLGDPVERCGVFRAVLQGAVVRGLGLGDVAELQVDLRIIGCHRQHSLEGLQCLGVPALLEQLLAFFETGQP